MKNQKLKTISLDEAITRDIGKKGTPKRDSFDKTLEKEINVMKTLSYKQPWAFLVAAGIKPIENRTWKLPEKYKGQRVLVHASAKLSISISMFEHLTEQQRWQAFEVLSIEDYQRDLKTSAIIGSVEIVDCVMNHPSIWAEHEATVYSQKQGKKIIVPVWNWVLANPVLFAEPILNVKGKLNYWDYSMTEEEYFNLLKNGNPLSDELKYQIEENNRYWRNGGHNGPTGHGDICYSDADPGL